MNFHTYISNKNLHIFGEKRLLAAAETPEPQEPTWRDSVGKAVGEVADWVRLRVEDENEVRKDTNARLKKLAEEQRRSDQKEEQERVTDWKVMAVSYLSAMIQFRKHEESPLLSQVEFEQQSRQLFRNVLERIPADQILDLDFGEDESLTWRNTIFPAIFDRMASTSEMLTSHDDGFGKYISLDVKSIDDFSQLEDILVENLLYTLDLLKKGSVEQTQRLLHLTQNQNTDTVESA